ncbi:MAG: O-acetyl-ADP-ribose deacetylase [Eubacteriales bacterium]|jgi:O-acetyl-ADP-ribose deacetylase
MRFQIVQGDITKMRTDAIVNAANTSLLGGGGVDGAIHRAAGPELLAECRTLHGCETGQAKITKGYRLPAKYVIHTPGPVWRGGNNGEPELLQSCYRSCLLLAAQNHCRSVAFPSISTGVYRFPLKLAAEIAVKTILDYCRDDKGIEEVFMVCFDSNTKAVYDEAFKKETMAI